jgi:hypothetical protein
MVGDLVAIGPAESNGEHDRHVRVSGVDRELPEKYQVGTAL